MRWQVGQDDLPSHPQLLIRLDVMPRGEMLHEAVRGALVPLDEYVVRNTAQHADSAPLRWRGARGNS